MKVPKFWRIKLIIGTACQKRRKGQICWVTYPVSSKKKYILFLSRGGNYSQSNNTVKYNQPGVEAYKKSMFALLGKWGFEDRKAELEKRL